MSQEIINRRKALKRSGLLIGGTLTVSALMTAMQGCKVPMDPDWAPSFFTEEESETLGYLAEAIIPKTDTPGALDAKVHRYLDVMASEVLPAEDTEKFRGGLNDFRSFCKETFGKDFISLDEVDQVKALESAAAATSDSGPTFFEVLRRSVVAGFFTSELGATQVLKFDPIPGSYEPCVPLEDVGGTWAI